MWYLTYNKNSINVNCLIFLLLLEKLTYQKQIGGFKVFGGIFFFLSVVFLRASLIQCNFRSKSPNF